MIPIQHRVSRSSSDNQDPGLPLVIKLIKPTQKFGPYLIIPNTLITLSTPLIALETVIRTLGLIFLSPMLCAGDQASRFYKREFIDLTKKSIICSLVAPFTILVAAFNLAALVSESIKDCLKHKSEVDSGAYTRGPIGSSMVSSK